MVQNSPSHRPSPRGLVLGLLVAAGMVASGFTGALSGGAAVYLAVSRATLAPVTAGASQQVRQIQASYDVTTAVTEAVARVGPAVVTVVNHLQPQRRFLARPAKPPHRALA